MLGLPLGVALLLQVQPQPPAMAPATVVRDSAGAVQPPRSAPRRLPVTAEALATAFRDQRAGELFYRARAARLAQDSSLRSYDARVRTRESLGLNIGVVGRERLVYRKESASRVRWQQGVGAHVELTGSRMVAPIATARNERNEFLSNLVDGVDEVIPYYPGYESLGLGGRAEVSVDERRIVHPLAEGAEAYYTYALGDSIRYRLPDGSTVQLRALQVRPRSPQWNLAVGSLMFDTKSGQLVQAAYRLAAPRNASFLRVEVSDTNELGLKARIALGVVKGIVPNARHEVSEITVEYSLHDGRFWMPRSRYVKGVSQIGAIRVPFTMEHAYRYGSINGGDTLPSIVVNTPNYIATATQPDVPDSLTGEAARKWRDSVVKVNRAARDALRDSLETGACDATGTRTLGRSRYDGQLVVAVAIPCDVDRLIESPDFTTPIYEKDEAVFDSANRDQLISAVLSLAAQGAIGSSGFTLPRVQYGLSMTRYNRVEGLSTGLLVEQQLGGGYVSTAVGRFGFADRRPNGELSLARTNLTRTVALTGYLRLVSANDWGRPLSFGASVSGLLFGRDEGFYYRATGAELTFQTSRGPTLEWRLFGERQRSARQETGFSLIGDFVPNIAATGDVSAGAAVRWAHSLGLDPRGFRTLTDVRLEGAGGDSTYGRGALDVTLSHGLPQGLAGALTLAVGSTVGGVPPQRRWFLGGNQTVRGQSPDTAQSGNAFWLARGELGRDIRVLRLSAFGDLGWVGDRTRMADVGRPLSGVGIGASLLDGALRLDVARGLYPRRQFRVDLSIGARW